MDIPKIIKEHHQAMIDKGFYDCPECGGNGEVTIQSGFHPNIDFDNVACEICTGSGIDPNKNIGELLMLIVSELSEALEAHRKGRLFKNVDMALDFNMNYQEDSEIKSEIGRFEFWVKDTFEDEIADVFLRLFDLCGYIGVEPNRIIGSSSWEFRKPNTGDKLRIISKKILELNPDYPKDDNFKTILGYSILYLEILCKEHSIPIEKHIYAKMAYNKSRPHKHGKEY